MSWSFYNDPVNVRRDRVRLLCGDYLANEPFISDEVLDWLLETWDDEYQAAAEACGIIAARLLREADVTVGELSVKLSERAKSFMERGLALKKEASLGQDLALPILARQHKRDPLFWIGQFDKKS